MKKIGMFGGISWESTQVYYQILNKKVNEALGGFDWAKISLESVGFDEIEKLQRADDWAALDQYMVTAAQNIGDHACGGLNFTCTLFKLLVMLS